jgi:hypothetical protein
VAHSLRPGERRTTVRTQTPAVGAQSTDECLNTMTRKRALLLLILLTPLAATVPLLLAMASRSQPEPATVRPYKSVKPVETDGLSPRAKADEKIYNFGIMDPLQQGTHRFTIRNEGQAPLELTPGATTCKCTLSKLSRNVIPQGETGGVELTWNTGRKDIFYSHSATIHTNDPLRKRIDFRIQGTVRVQLGAAPPELMLEGIEPDRPKTVGTWLYSQTWDAIDIELITCSRDDIQWQLEPAEPTEAPELEAKSLCRLTVTVPEGLPEGYLQEVLTCVYRTEAGDTDTLELTLSGKVLRRLAVYGPGINHLGTLDLGLVHRGEELDRRLVLKVRDPQPELGLGGIEVTPDFVEVNVTPYQTDSQATGLYQLDVHIPASAPEGDYRSLRAGRITLRVGHPRIDDLEMPLSFAVLDAR